MDAAPLPGQYIIFIKFVVKKGLFIGQIGHNRSPNRCRGLEMRVEAAPQGMIAQSIGQR
jgi:hypothetical protein